MTTAQLAVLIPALTALVTAITGLVALLLHKNNPNAHPSQTQPQPAQPTESPPTAQGAGHGPGS